MESAGCRRLWVLIQGLPPDAAVWRQETAWTNQDELAAAHMELLDMWMRIQVQIWTGNKPKGKPLRIERPNQTPEAPKAKRKRNPKPEEVIAFFGQIK